MLLSHCDPLMDEECVTAPSYEIIHSDPHLVVTHKDAGLLTVAARGQTCLIDLVEAELDRRSFGRYRLRAVHRLDQQTSGLVVFARSPQVAQLLAKQFASHRIQRQYIAVVVGHLARERGALNSPIDGKRALTHYAVLARTSSTTTVAVRLETGRRNQIRRHFTELGHPLVGDQRFGEENAAHPDWPLTRIALHARLLGFWHPTLRKAMLFDRPCPSEFLAFASAEVLAEPFADDDDDSHEARATVDRERILL